MNIQLPRFAILLIVLLTLGSAAPLCAQDSGPSLQEAWYITVKPGHQAAFEEAFKAHAAARQEHGDPRDWHVYTPVTGHGLNQYTIRSCCHAWAEQDAYDKWNRDNAAVMEHWMSEVDAHVESYAHYFYEVDGQNSHWPEDSGPIGMVGVSNYYIAPGHRADFSAAREKLSQIALNQGWTEGGHRWVWLDRVGGKPVVVLAVAFENYADMAPEGPSFYEFLSEHVGAEEAGALMHKLSSSTKGSTYTIWATRPDLSTAH